MFSGLTQTLFVPSCGLENENGAVLVDSLTNNSFVFQMKSLKVTQMKLLLESASASQ